MIFTIVAIFGLLLMVVGAIVFLQSKMNINEKVLALAATGNFVDARALVRTFLDGDPTNQKLLYLLSKVYNMEKDFLNEANCLEKIKNVDKLDKSINPIQINNRLGDIYYQMDMYDESFFHYSDTIKNDPHNFEALFRLSFMALGQKEFGIAEKYMKSVTLEQVKNSTFNIGRGIVSVMLGREDEVTFFEKAYETDSKSNVAAFLYAFSLSDAKKFKEALEIANKIADNTSEELVRYTLFQFVMCQYIRLKDFDGAAIHAKLCVDIAKHNDWKYEISESCFYFAILLIFLEKLDDASEYLIEAESNRVDDFDIINLANFKMDLEEKKAINGQTSSRGYNIKSEVNLIPEKLFSRERYFEFSGLKAEEAINIKGIVNDEGTKIISRLNQLQVNVLIKFLSLKGNSFKNFGPRLVNELGYKMKREMPCFESDGLNFLGMQKDNEDDLAVFRIRKWKNTKISDVFLNDMLDSMNSQNAKAGYIIGGAELTPGAKKVMSANSNKIILINDNKLETLLAKAFQ